MTRITVEQGDIVTAERLLREALDINLKAYDRSHNAVSISMNNLAQVLQAKVIAQFCLTELTRL